MKRPALLLVLLAVAAVAEPQQAEKKEGRRAEAAILERWHRAGPDERRHMRPVLERVERSRRFVEARPILIAFGKERLTLAELFKDLLEPALATGTKPRTKDDLGLEAIHRDALGALGALRAAHAPPAPIRTATLNLLLKYAYDALGSPAMHAPARLRFFIETMRNVRAFDGRVRPDARTRWLVHHRLLPALLGLARRMARDPVVRETVSEAASLLYLPSILDEGAQAQLAPLTRGVHSREILVRSYRRAALDDLGVLSLARSVALQLKDDAAFAAGAPPLILELLTDARLGGRARAALLAPVLDGMARVQPLRDTARDLAAAGFGGAPRALDQYERAGSVPAPAGDRAFRFLSVVLRMRESGMPPVVSRVVRADSAFYAPIRIDDGRGGTRFVGTLVPAASGDHADLLGPPPGLSGARDNRLLRRTLELERIAIATFGARGEVVELSVALPEDASEPVPRRNAALQHVFELIRSRIERTVDSEELRDLVRLLVRIGTAPARALAVRHATTADSIGELLPLVERGDVAAAGQVLSRIEVLPLEQRERAFVAVLSTGNAGLYERVTALCGHTSVSVATLAADALLGHGDPAGVRALLEHENRYARACGTSLALRLTVLAGSLKVIPSRAVPLKELERLATGAFSRKDGECWARYSRWLGVAFSKPDDVRKARSSYETIGRQEASPAAFASFWLSNLNEGKHEKYWATLPPFVLSPAKPGRGIPERQLGPLLDALEARAAREPLRTVWMDSLVVLACAQYGIEADPQYLRLAHERLRRAAGKRAPAGARRKAGVYWPIWAAEVRR